MVDVFVRTAFYFTILSVFGYIMEIIFCSIEQKKIVNRGFLFGPYLPVYGFGGLCVIFFANIFKITNPFIIFFSTAIIGAIIEYVSSFLLEKIFHLRWWDYTGIRKFQLNGRVCLRNVVLFGVAGCVIILIFLPLIDNIIDFFPRVWRIILASSFCVIFLLDFALSSYANIKAEKMMKTKKVFGDQTTEIKFYARMAIKQVFATPEKLMKLAEKETQRRQKQFLAWQKQMEKKSKRALRKATRTSKKLLKKAKS